MTQLTVMTTVHLAVYDTLADWEIGYLTTALNSDLTREPVELRTVAAGAGPIRTKGGLRIQPDLTLAELSPTASACLVLPGADHWTSGALSDFAAAAKVFVGEHVPVAAICGAVWGIAAAGLLDERAHTGADPGFLAASGYRGGARYRSDAVSVSDGLVVTASPIAPVEFARDVLATLDLCDPKRLDAWFRLFRYQEAAAYAELQRQDR
ncbi:DJ-1/PfpI family protein [Skermania piniformis]|nr:DJ-1/PfpI family protein [Skermania piniformis]